VRTNAPAGAVRPQDCAGPRIANRSEALAILGELIEDAILEGTRERLNALRAPRIAIDRKVI